MQHVIDYKNWRKRKLAIFSADSAVRSNVQGVLELLEYPSVVFLANDSDLDAQWAKEKNNIFGIIITGSSMNVGEPFSPMLPKAMLTSGLPILGICYGHQFLLTMLGAEMKRCAEPIGEHGSSFVTIDLNNRLFKGLTENRYIVNMSHNWMINEDTMPAGCNIIASSNLTPIVGFHNPKKKWYGVQFHPEKNYMHNIIFKNFVELCYERL